MSLWADARILVGDGEAEGALDLIDTFIKGRLQGAAAGSARALHDSLVLLRATGRRLAVDRMQGTVPQAEYDHRRARYEQSVLALIGEAERLDKRPQPTEPAFPTDAVDVEKLMGVRSHLRSTGWLAEGLRLASAVCRLVDDRSFGTGFRCGPAAIATNNHVIENEADARRFRAEFFFEEDAAGRLRTPTVVRLAPERLFWTSPALDVTLVALAEPVPDNVAIVPLRAVAGPKVLDHVTIIQHPNGGPKQIAATNNVVVNLFDTRVQYLTDTLPGSSGAPVFLDSWEAIAIHRAGGNMRKNARGEVIYANEGVLVRVLHEDTGFRAAHASATS